jgi:hypothetical protein
MRWFKVAAIAGGVLIAFLIVSSVVGFVAHLVFDLVIAAVVIGAIAVAIKVARSGKQVSRGRDESEIREREARPLPRADVEPFSAPARPVQPKQSTADIDEELARLKREMGA